MKAASVGFQCPSCVKDGAASVRQPRAAYGGRAGSTPIVSYVLIGLNVLAFLGTGGFALSAFGGSSGAPSKAFLDLALQPYAVANGQSYRLLTSTFLHFGLLHILFNMLCLVQLGPALERALGRLRFTVLYLLSGLGGAALSYALGPVGELAAGASGAVFGLFAAFFVLQRRGGGDVSAISGTIGINLLLSFALPGIDWRGHVGGLVAGALVTLTLVYAPAGARRGLLQLAGVVAVAVLVAVVVVARTAQLTAA